MASGAGSRAVRRHVSSLLLVAGCCAVSHKSGWRKRCHLPSMLSASFVASTALRVHEEKSIREFQKCVKMSTRAACVKTLLSQLELPPSNYTPSDRGSFLARFDGLPIRPTPNVALGALLREHKNHVAENRRSYYFYGNGATDLSLYTHFFARPMPVRGGAYIEIGGGNGVHAANTLFFEQQLGWRGTLIEPTVCARCLIPRTRPNDRVVHAAACPEPTTLNISTRGQNFCPGQQVCLLSYNSGCHAAHPLSDAAITATCRQASCMRDQPPVMEIPCLPMAHLLQGTPRRVDLLVVDVEQHVMTVLRTLPWDTMRFEVVVAECTGEKLAARCEKYLQARGYGLLRSRFNGDIVAVRKECIAD